jgi:hypothetical protein
VRHFESRSSSRLVLRVALLAALAHDAIACSSDSDHGPPVGAPNVPVVIVEGGGAEGSVNTGQGAANNAGNTSDTGVGGSSNAAGGAPFTNPSAGSANFGSPGTAGSPSGPPFSAGGSPSAFGGSTF